MKNPGLLVLYITDYLYIKCIFCDKIRNQQFYAIFNFIFYHLICLFPTYTDVFVWLKSLRLHKYSNIFSELSYDEMLELTEDFLKSKVSFCRISISLLAIYRF